MKHLHTFSISIETDQDAETTRKILDRFLTIGVEDAERTVNNGEGDIELAEAATHLSITGPHHLGSSAV